MDKISCVILAAGEGTRFKWATGKPLAPILGKRLVDFPLNSIFCFLEEKKLKGAITLVVGHKRQELEDYITASYEKKPNFVVQKEQNGTADALRSYFDGFDKSSNFEYTLVMAADTPLIRQNDLAALFSEIETKKLDAICATFQANNPTGYGRVVRGNKGFKIVEHKDADEKIRAITEVNSGLYIFKTEFLKKHLSGVENKNKSGEFYLTDLFQENFNVTPFLFEKSETFFGVNTLEQLEYVSRVIREEKIGSLRDSGVFFVDSKTNYIDWDVEIGKGTQIGPFACVKGKTKIASNCLIDHSSIVINSILHERASVHPFSHLEEVTLGKSAGVGPYARLRPGALIGPKSKIGNFVEIKKAKLDAGVKVSHLSYVGDAEIGENSNIGCGFITCNYDGAKKHLTKIGKNCFIGSDSQMIAPVELGDNCYVASGSTINKSMENDSFAIARARQVTKEGMAKRFMKKKD